MKIATETLTAAARAATPADRFDDVQRTVMTIMGLEALVCFRLNPSEHARRQRARAATLSSADMLDLLLGLPAGVPVEIGSLTRREQAALDHAPRGAVSVHDGVVTRHAVVPTAVELAVVAARSWQSGLEAAGRFAPFCARAMMLTKRPVRLAEALMQADFYGIGVIVVDRDGVDVLVEPTPFKRVRFSAAGWRFLEEVYRRGV